MTEYTDAEPEYFTGRQALYARLRQYMLNPRETALTLTGQTGVGKSAFLRHFRQNYDTHFVGVYLPLGQSHLENETAWLWMLVSSTTAALEAYGFGAIRLPNFPEDDAASIRAWLANEYLPEVIAVIRARRRLVWLLDDIGFLISAMTDKRLPDDSAVFLHSLIQAQPQLSIVMSARIDYEHRLSRLAPLYHPAVVQRMEPLILDESRDLLQQAAPGLSDADVLPVYQSTGGSPLLLQRYARRLSALPQETLSAQDVAAVTAGVYGECAAEFRDLWRSLSRDERLVLTGVSSLIYQDAGRAVSSADVVRWLRASDYSMDIIAVNAALRSLEYHEILAGSAQGMVPATGLMQTWLLDNARLDESRPRSPSALSRRMLMGLLVTAGFIIILVMAVVSQSLPPERSGNQPVATVTLSQQGRSTATPPP